MNVIAPEIVTATRRQGRRLPGLAALLPALVSLWSAAPALASAGPGTSTATGLAVAQIVRPLAVNGIDDLDFGMAASIGPGTVTIEAGAALASYGGSARAACTGAGPCPQPHAARFEVTGERDRDYRIVVPQELRIAAPGSPRAGGELTISAFTVRSASRPDAGRRGATDASGRDRFEVGATLVLTGALAPAHYTVAVPVTVAYD